jgi:hypothetical protein
MELGETITKREELKNNELIFQKKKTHNKHKHLVTSVSLTRA